MHTFIPIMYSSKRIKDDAIPFIVYVLSLFIQLIIEGISNKRQFKVVLNFKLQNQL